MNGRFARSWALAKESWAILKMSPQMLLFPVISGVFTIIAAVSFFVPLYIVTDGHFKESKPLSYTVTAVFYFVTYFVVIFFNAGLVSCAFDRLNGRPTTFAAGLQGAWRRIGAILGWTAIASTVGLLLQILREEAGSVGRIISSIIGFVWSVLTFFVVPIIVIESGSPVQAIKKSGSMLKRTWGENLIGQGGIGLALLAFWLVPVLLLIPIAMSGIALLIIPYVVLLALYYIALSVVASSLSVIYQTALYIYSETGRLPNGFTPVYVQTAFVTKPPRRFGGRL